nr:Chain D, Histone deacetylase 5 [Homo sapiens]
GGSYEAETVSAMALLSVG